MHGRRECTAKGTRVVPETEKYFEGDGGAAAAQPLLYQKEAPGSATD